MFSVDTNNIISVTRGDSFSLPLFINEGSDLKPIRYIIQPGDTIYFALMQCNQYFENAIVKKVFTSANLNENNDIIITFNPEDTEQLIPGKYYYQIKAKLLNEDGNYIVNTIIDKTEFFILE